MLEILRWIWWVVPAMTVGVFDALLFVGQVTGLDAVPGGDWELRAGLRVSVAAACLLAAGCMGAGLALRGRRPERAVWLVILGSVPRC